MQPTKTAATSAYMFLASGIAFLVAGYIGNQVAFYGVGAAFIALGAVQYHKAKTDK